MSLVDALLRRPSPKEVGVQVATPVTEIPSPEPVESPYPDTIGGLRKRIEGQARSQNRPAMYQELLKAYPVYLNCFRQIRAKFMQWADSAHQPFEGTITGRCDGDSEGNSYWRSGEELTFGTDTLTFREWHARRGMADMKTNLEIIGDRWGENITSVVYRELAIRGFGVNEEEIPMKHFEVTFAPNGTPLSIQIMSDLRLSWS